jgi:hypothetical protein
VTKFMKAAQADESEKTQEDLDLIQDKAKAEVDSSIIEARGAKLSAQREKSKAYKSWTHGGGTDALQSYAEQMAKLEKAEKALAFFDNIKSVEFAEVKE